jgi:hypothetical protein
MIFKYLLLQGQQERLQGLLVPLGLDLQLLQASPQVPPSET